jgi:hypothetical protein
VPFKSEAQRRKFYAMQERGEISKDKVKEYEEKTKGDLPERAKAKEKASEYIKRKKKSSNG